MGLKNFDGWEERQAKENAWLDIEAGYQPVRRTENVPKIEFPNYIARWYEVYEIVSQRNLQGEVDRDVCEIAKCWTSAEAFGLANKLRAEDTSRDIRVDLVAEYYDNRVVNTRLR